MRYIEVQAEAVGCTDAREPWTAEEDDRLRRAMADHAPVDGATPPWLIIMRAVRTRSKAQCQTRWTEHLDPTFSREPLTHEDGIRIDQMLRLLGNDAPNVWSTIGKTLPVKRPPRYVRAAYTVLKRQRSKPNTLSTPAQRPDSAFDLLEFAELHPSSLATLPVGSIPVEALIPSSCVLPPKKRGRSTNVSQPPEDQRVPDASGVTDPSTFPRLPPSPRTRSLLCDEVLPISENVEQKAVFRMAIPGTLADKVLAYMTPRKRHKQTQLSTSGMPATPASFAPQPTHTIAHMLGPLPYAAGKYFCFN